MTSPLSPPTTSPPRATRTRISSATAFGLLYRTFVRSVRTRGRLVVLAALTGVAVVLSLIDSAADDETTSWLHQGLDTAQVITGHVVAIGVLLIASAVLGDLYDNGSVVYVALRPVSNRVVAVAAWAAACTLVLPFAVVSAVSVGLVHSGDGLPAATVLATVIGALAYASIFGFTGVLVRRALPAGLAYLLLWEGFVSYAGKGGATLSIGGYLRSILAEITGAEVGSAPFALATGIIVPLVVTVLGLLATGWLLDRRELP